MALKDVRLCVRDVEAGEDRVLRERLSATFSLHFFFSNSYLVAMCSSRTINVMWLISYIHELNGSKRWTKGEAPGSAVICFGTVP